MQRQEKGNKTILITGGTSGLGLELSRLFLNLGHSVVVTGRNQPSSHASEHRFSYFRVDFDNLDETAAVIRKICRYYSFDIVIDNAGVLSPPDYRLTADRLEYTFQVNFISHLLLNEIIIRNNPSGHRLTIASVTSLVYRIAEKDLISKSSEAEYSPIKAYSNSKLYLALMCSYLRDKYSQLNLTAIGFDPGVFSSGIYRTQKRWFVFLYRVAAPFMRNPRKVARRLAEIVLSENPENGAIYDFHKKARPVPGIDHTIKSLFWKDAYQNIEKYLD